MKTHHPRPIPDFFLRGLKIIDPSYFVMWNPIYAYFEIKVKLYKEMVDKETKQKVVFRNPTVAVFEHCNEAALQDMRKRKYIGRQYEDGYHQGDTNYSSGYIKDLLKRNKELKAKRVRENRKFMAEVLMDFEKFSESQSFSAGPKKVATGANNDGSRNKNTNPQYYQGVLDRHGKPIRKRNDNN